MTGIPTSAVPSTATATAAAASTPATGVDTSRLASKDNLAKAGQQFESVFTGMMLKSMRQAKLADPLFDSKALDTFRDMQDQLTVKAMAEHTPLGIGKAMTDFLGRNQSLAPSAGASDAQASETKPVLNQPSATESP